MSSRPFQNSRHDFGERKFLQLKSLASVWMRIEKLNPTLNAFITVMAESAMVEAQQAEAEIARGNWRGPLHGIPVALKDLIDTAGVRTTSGSAFHEKRVPDRRCGGRTKAAARRRGDRRQEQSARVRLWR